MGKFYGFDNQKGINRIEILVAAGLIIGIIIIAILGFFQIQENLRDSKRKADIGVIASSLEIHYNTKDNQYCEKGFTGSYCHPQLHWFEGGVPTDPLWGDYFNLPQNGDKQYLICAKLERGGGNAASSDGTLTSNKSGQFYCQRNLQS